MSSRSHDDHAENGLAKRHLEEGKMVLWDVAPVLLTAE